MFLHSGSVSKQNLWYACLLLLLLQARLECYAFFPSVVGAVRLRIKKRDVQCDHSSRNDVFSISCQEYVVDSVLRRSL